MNTTEYKLSTLGQSRKVVDRNELLAVSFVTVNDFLYKKAAKPQVTDNITIFIITCQDPE